MFSRYLNVYGVTVFFQTEYKSLLDKLTEDYGRFFLKRKNRPHVDIEFQVLKEPREPVEEKYSFRMNLQDSCFIDRNRIVMWGKNLKLKNAYEEEVRPYLTTFISIKQIEKHETFLVHASAVRMLNKGILFPGEKRCGKTSLALQCILNEAEYLSDELAFIRRHRHGVYIMGLPQAINVGIGSAKWFRRKWPRRIPDSYIQPYEQLDSLTLFGLEVGKKLTISPKALIKHNISLPVSNLDIIIFAEANFALKEPRIMALPEDISIIKLQSNIIPPFKWNFWAPFDFKTYMKKIVKLLECLRGNVCSYFLQWSDNHDKNYNLIKAVVAESIK